RRPGVRRKPARAARLLLPPAPVVGRAVQPLPGAAHGDGARAKLRATGSRMHATTFPSLVRLLGLALAFMLAACVAAPDHARRAGGPAHGITLVTLNLWHDKGDWPARQRVIVEALRE